MIRILVADDDDGLRRVIQYKLSQRGYEVVTVEDGAKALEKVKSGDYNLVLSDMKMPGLNGIELLSEIKKVKPDLAVILITAHAEINQAVQAVKLGAFDYLPKPFEDEQLFHSIEKALKFINLEQENVSLRKKLNERKKSTYIAGISDSYKRLIETVDKVSPTDTTVLLTGDSGTGKEVIAKYIHEHSTRSSSDLITVNCAAIPKDLLESELFGHKKGAFTGAIADKKGKFELAHLGTLFLDEISELSTDLQAKLLRAIQEKVIEPLGSEKKIEVDIRLIAATNRDLKQQVDKDLFREDLYYRLNVIPIQIPKLKERTDDIPIFIKSFLKKFSPHKEISVSKTLLKMLKQYSWPGNIRELENLIERMVVLRQTDELTENDLPPDFNNLKSTNPADTEISLHDAEKSLIESALIKNGYNKSKAAKQLKIPRHVLIYRLKKYNISEGSK